MVGTCKRTTDEKQKWLVIDIRKNKKHKRHLQSTIAKTALGSPTPEASIFISGIPFTVAPSPNNDSPYTSASTSNIL
jgi:hypothetical protein